MQTNRLLINEVNLGTRLNHAVSDDRRGEFALLLAMLSDDARDMAQFNLPHSLKDTESRLHQQFELPQSQPLLANIAEDAVTDNSAAFHQQGMSAFHLQQSLTPEALVIRGHESMAMNAVLNNCDPITLSRYRGELNPQIGIQDILHFADQVVAQRTMADIMI